MVGPMVCPSAGCPGGWCGQLGQGRRGGLLALLHQVPLQLLEAHGLDVGLQQDGAEGGGGDGRPCRCRHPYPLLPRLTPTLAQVFTLTLALALALPIPLPLRPTARPHSTSGTRVAPGAGCSVRVGAVATRVAVLAMGVWGWKVPVLAVGVHPQAASPGHPVRAPGRGPHWGRALGPQPCVGHRG